MGMSPNLLSHRYERGGPYRRSYTFVAVIIIIILACAPYLQTLSRSFEFLNWDDQYYVTQNLLIRDFSFAKVRHIFTHFHFTDYMPVNMLSLAADYAIWGTDENGDIDPRGFHLTNFLLHALSAVLTFFFLRLILKRPMLALIGAVVFAAHPVQTETVAWVSERKSVLSAAMMLGSLVCYIGFDQRKGERLAWMWYLVPVALTAVGCVWYAGALVGRDFQFAHRTTTWIFAVVYGCIVVLSVMAVWRRCGVLYGAALVLAAVSVFAKPITIVIPAILFLYMLCFSRKWWIGPTLDKLPFVAVAVIGAYAGYQAQKHAGTVLSWHGGNPVYNIVTMFSVWPRYVRVLLLPFRLQAVYHPPVFLGLRSSVMIMWGVSSGVVLVLFGGLMLLVRYMYPKREIVWLLVSLAVLLVGAGVFDPLFPMWEPAQVISIAIGMAALGTMGRLCVLSWYRHRELFFWLIWIPVLILPVSNLVPMNTLMADRYLYLPAIGFGAIVAVIIRSLSGGHFAVFSSRLGRGIAVACVIVIVLLLGVQSESRARVWKEPYALWSDSVMKEPNGAILRTNLGQAYNGKAEENAADRGLKEYYRAKARTQLEKALEYESDLFFAVFDMGMMTFEDGDYKRALELFGRAKDLDRKHAESFFYLGLTYGAIKDEESMAQSMQEAIKRDPNHARAVHNLGTYYSNRREYENALELYRRAVEIDPKSDISYYNIGTTLFQLKRHDEGIEALRRCLEVTSPNGQIAATVKRLIRKYETKGPGL